MGPAVPSAGPVVKTAPAGRRRRRVARRRVGGGGRGAQAVSLITERPGVTIGELAKRMGIGRTYLYSVLPKLELEGRVSRRGSGWYPAGV
jgi:predicted Rossmann fold nucleotide-binding protein DprA/Smf involved in DNA uptake